MIVIDREKCQGCAACLNACNSGAIYLVDNKAHVDLENCTSCERCMDVCPVGAIRLIKSNSVQRRPTAQIPTAKMPEQPTFKTALATLGNTLLPQLITKLSDLIHTAASESRPNRSNFPQRRSSSSGSGRHFRRRYRGGK